MARIRALRLREMRLYHLSHGGHAKNPEMVVPNHMYIYGGDIFLLYGTFSDGMFSDGMFSDGTFSDGTFCM